MNDPFQGAIDGRTVAKLTVLPMEADSGSPVAVTMEFTDGSRFSFVTDQSISVSVDGYQYMKFSPVA